MILRPPSAAAAALIALGALLGSAWATASQAEELRIVLGTQKRVALSSDVQRVAIGDPNVTQVHLLTSRELLALGRGVGRTNVLLWTADGRVDELRLRVERDLSLLATALRGIHESIRVSAAPDRDAVVLRGTVPEARHASAAEAMALDYLGEDRSEGEVYVRSPDATAGEGAASAGDAGAGNGGSDAGAVFLAGEPRRSDADVINLIQVDGIPPALEERIARAIAPIGGAEVRVRRLVQGSIPHDEDDTFVLEGKVRGQVELVRVLLAAARLVAGRQIGDGSIEVLANEAGSLTTSGGDAGVPGVQIASVGGFTGSAGSLGGSAVGNDLSSNVARAKALSVAGGRILAFIEVSDLPQVRLETRIYEVSRSRLRDWEPNLSVLYGDDLDDLALLPSPTSLVLQGEDAPMVTPTQVQAAASLLRGGAASAGVQYVSEHVAVDATLRLLEDASIARSLARPTLTVLSGEVARFSAGGQIPIDVTVDTETSAGTGTLLSSTVFASFGVDVSVRPMVAEDDAITLDVTPTVAQPDFKLTAEIAAATGSEQSTTAFETRALTTTARLRDGQSLVIAGFLQSSLTEDSRFTPGLHRVPGLGWAAKSLQNGTDDTDFVVVVSPSIVRERLSRSELWVFPDPGELLDGIRTRPVADNGTREPRSARTGGLARAHVAAEEGTREDP
ncbi:MAG: pilus assembly protein N-terminal domain-containing protein [Myxococcota bacterium]